ncbi:nucleobase:cation symporter-2 family protein [Streptomyces sp. NPDC097619]|uniref:nucleobase:cation symporter-2 family protein n=1 Tax=Streptomyces sp. NPDC097619 TaxID=3157228 RepID=UPI003327825D
MRPRARRGPHRAEDQPTPRPPAASDPTGDEPHPVDELLPVRRLLPAALQHVAGMYAGIAAPPLIIGGALGLSAAHLSALLSAALLCAGLATVAQTLGLRGIGSRLPLTGGVSFAVVSPLLALTDSEPENALPLAFGASLVAGLAGLLLAPVFTRLLRWFPPLVSGSVITLIGLSLLPVAAGWARGGDPDSPDFGSASDLALAGGTLAVTLALHRLLSGRFLGRIAVLLGMAVGTLMAVPMGKVGLEPLRQAPLFALPEPFAFGAPQFQGAAIATALVVMLVSMTESTASLMALGAVVGRPADGRTVAGGLRAQGAATALGAVLGSFMTTTYAQNVGLVAFSRIRSRWVVTCCGAILVLMGLVPVLGSLVALVPLPVLGGAAVVFFGSVAVTGIRTLAKAALGTGHNGLIVSVTLAFGLFPIAQPDLYARLPEPLSTVLGSGVTAGCLVAVLLNVLLNHLGRGTEADEDHVPDAVPTPRPAAPTSPGGPPGDPSWSAFTPRDPARHGAVPPAPHPGNGGPGPYGPGPGVPYGGPYRPAPRPGGGLPHLDPEAVRAALLEQNGTGDGTESGTGDGREWGPGPGGAPASRPDGRGFPPPSW